MGLSWNIIYINHCPAAHTSNTLFLEARSNLSKKIFYLPFSNLWHDCMQFLPKTNILQAQTANSWNMSLRHCQVVDTRRSKDEESIQEYPPVMGHAI